MGRQRGTGSSANETEPATSDHGNDDFFCSDVQIGSEGEEEVDTLHYKDFAKPKRLGQRCERVLSSLPFEVKLR